MSYSNKVGTTEKDSSMKLSEALSLFVKEYAYIKGLDPQTIRGYKNTLSNFKKVHGDKEINLITIEDIYYFRKYFEDKGISSATIRNNLGDIKMLLKHISKTVELSLVPDDIPLPKFIRNMPETLTIDEIKLIVDHTRNLRDRLAIYLLFCTGIRIAELCSLKVQDIQEDKLLIHGKGKKQRYAYLDEVSLMLIKLYLPSLDGEWLFPSSNLKGMPLQTFAMRIAIKRSAEKAGITKRIYPHMFRHSYATNLLKNGCDIRYIQEFLGHNYITSTQIYTHVTNQDLAGAYKKFHVTLN